MSATAVCPDPLHLRSELSLEQVLARAYEITQADGASECPVCGGDFTPHGLDARCEDCGARLF